MKVLLIDPPGWQKHSVNLGLAYLSGSLSAAGADNLIVDLNNHAYPEERLKVFIRDYGTGIIGVSVKTATADASTELIRQLKAAFPQITIIVGGPHITLCAKEFLEENEEIDLGIVGEGERALVELVGILGEGGKDFSGIKGLCYRKEGAVVCNACEAPEISSLAFPSFQRIKDMDFTDFRYPLLTSRGCPHGCIFCCVGLISGRKWRGRQPEDVVNELVCAKEDYQVASFEITDDNFTLDINRAKKICRLIIKNKLNLHWWCHNGIRADVLDQELLCLMKKAGCTSIALGIESGDEKVFNNINKGEKLSDILRAVKMIKKAGIRCVGYFIVGLPGDSIESTKRTVRFQRGLGLSDYKYGMLVPYPGTKIWEMVKEKGRLLTDIKGIYHFGDNIKIPFETDKISRKTLEQCMHLVENQKWMYGESDVRKTKKRFDTRVGRDIQKAAVVENDADSLAKYLEIEWKHASVLRMQDGCAVGEIKDKYVLRADCEGSYFNSLFRLAQEEGYRIIIDIPKRRLLMQKEKKGYSEFIRGELLPPPQEWDSSPRKYLACKLKNSSPDICSAKNGVVYKDNIALPFSASFQLENVPCGKIESGIAFISPVAFSLDSTYTADYVTSEKESGLHELVLSDNKDSALGRILSELDILFYPEVLGYFFTIFSRAKMNAAYYNDGLEAGSSPYGISDPLSMGRTYHFIRKTKRVLNITRTVVDGPKGFINVAGKVSQVVILWVQIVMQRAFRF
jgi:anaerobic magnesium-protoporphyrin IX monomethyl ester cyclase